MPKDKRLYLFYSSTKNGQQTWTKIFSNYGINVWFNSEPSAITSNKHFSLEFTDKSQTFENFDDLNEVQKKAVQKVTADFMQILRGENQAKEYNKELHDICDEHNVPRRLNGSKLGLKKRVELFNAILENLKEKPEEFCSLRGETNVNS